VKEHKPTTAIVLDTRRARKDNTYPVKLRLTYKRQRQYYNVGIFMTKDDFNDVQTFSPNAKQDRKRKEYLKEKQQEFVQRELSAASVIKDLPVFTFDAFKKKYFDETDYSDLFSMLRQRIREMERENRPGMASSLQSTLKSWEDFHKKPHLPLEQITASTLKEYERYMLKAKKSPATIGIYIRNVRIIFNKAIKAKALKDEHYPFKEYQIPEGDGFKRALPKVDVLKIHTYAPLEGSPEHYYRDLWMFSYLCNGMNLADIAALKYKDIKSDKIVFYRQKTVRAKKKKLIIIEVTPEIAGIIKRWGRQPATNDSYIFSILKRGNSPAQQLAAVKQATKQLNKYIQRVAKAVGIHGKVTGYAARHSFASVLKLSGESTVFIQEALGHKDLKTTEHYLSAFDSEQRRKAQNKLL